MQQEDTDLWRSPQNLHRCRADLQGSLDVDGVKSVFNKTSSRMERMDCLVQPASVLKGWVTCNLTVRVLLVGFLVAFHYSRLSGPTSQFLNGTHELSELVLARMSLLMDQSRSVLPLRSAKAREFGELGREKMYACAFFHLNSLEPVLFGRSDGTKGKRP